jgi:cyclophilin family peptidyl-prolyl cis-trans isomerase
MKHYGLFALLAVALAVAPAAAQEKKNPVVVIDTSMGKIKLELFPKEAPLTVKNFLGYVDEKFYDGTLFHRVARGFVIQGGGLLPGLRPKRTHAPVKNEAGNGLANKRGTVAMARTDNPDSATSQFYINLKDSPHLDRAGDSAGYTVFGRVIDGADVALKISQVETGVGPRREVPREDVVIKSIRRVE